MLVFLRHPICVLKKNIFVRRCFVMPLNRENVLPPKSLFDLVHKMWDGYYKVDTDVVRRTMRVITPPITDAKEVGNYIAKECQGKPIYRLEKYVGGGKVALSDTALCFTNFEHIVCNHRHLYKQDVTTDYWKIVHALDLYCLMRHICKQK